MAERLCVHGCAGALARGWVCGCVSVLVCVGARARALHVCMRAWLHGCMGAWLSGWVVEGAWGAWGAQGVQGAQGAQGVQGA